MSHAPASPHCTPGCRVWHLYLRIQACVANHRNVCPVPLYCRGLDPVSGLTADVHDHFMLVSLIVLAGIPVCYFHEASTPTLAGYELL